MVSHRRYGLSSRSEPNLALTSPLPTDEVAAVPTVVNTSTHSRCGWQLTHPVRPRVCSDILVNSFPVFPNLWREAFSYSPCPLLMRNITLEERCKKCIQLPWLWGNFPGFTYMLREVTWVRVSLREYFLTQATALISQHLLTHLSHVRCAGLYIQVSGASKHSQLYVRGLEVLLTIFSSVIPTWVSQNEADQTKHPWVGQVGLARGPVFGLKEALGRGCAREFFDPSSKACQVSCHPGQSFEQTKKGSLLALTRARSLRYRTLTVMSSGKFMFWGNKEVMTNKLQQNLERHDSVIHRLQKFVCHNVQVMHTWLPIGDNNMQFHHMQPQWRRFSSGKEILLAMAYGKGAESYVANSTNYTGNMSCQNIDINAFLKGVSFWGCTARRSGDW